MVFFIVDESNDAAKSLVEKIYKAKTGQFIFVTHDEFYTWHDGIIKVEVGDVEVKPGNF